MSRGLSRKIRQTWVTGGKTFHALVSFSKGRELSKGTVKVNQMGVVDQLEICVVICNSVSPCRSSLYRWLCTLQLFLPHYSPRVVDCSSVASILALQAEDYPTLSPQHYFSYCVPLSRCIWLWSKPSHSATNLVPAVARPRATTLGFRLGPCACRPNPASPMRNPMYRFSNGSSLPKYPSQLKGRPDMYLRLTRKCEVGAQLRLKRVIWG